MSTSLTRLELTIDVVALPAQRALALASMTPPELVAAVLEEFRELDYLGAQPDDYIVCADDGAPLDAGRPLGAQLVTGAHLTLAERPVSMPEGTVRPHQALYLRERNTGQLFRLPWVPTIIGRPDPSLPENALIAVDLTAHPAGQRVSRRHARISERDGQYLIERLSPNPTAVADSAGRNIAVDEGPVPICHGDTLLLERSQIALVFLIHDQGSS